MEPSENTQQEQLDPTVGQDASAEGGESNTSADLPPVGADDTADQPTCESQGETQEQPSGEQSSEPESVAAININTDMPQESDPIASGEMTAVMDAMDVAGDVAASLERGGQPPAVISDEAGVVAVDKAADAGLPQPAAAELTEEEAFLADVAVNGTEVQKRMLNAICDFSFRLRPKAPIQPADCNKAQHEFLRHLQWLLKKDFNEFRQGWATLLIYFSVNHGTPTPRDYSALSEYSATRYMNHWSKSNEEAQLFTDLITLLRTTRNASTRKHNVKMISLEKIGVGLFTDKEISNLKQFYA